MRKIALCVFLFFLFKFDGFVEGSHVLSDEEENGSDDNASPVSISKKPKSYVVEEDGKPEKDLEKAFEERSVNDESDSDDPFDFTDPTTAVDPIFVDDGDERDVDRTEVNGQYVEVDGAQQDRQRSNKKTETKTTHHTRNVPRRAKFLAKDLSLPERIRIMAFENPVEVGALLMVICVFMQVYIGRKKNLQVALSWLQVAKSVFEPQFASLGHDGSYMQCPGWHVFEFYSTGRRNCKSCTCVLECIPRQCIWMSQFMSMVFREKDTLKVFIPVDPKTMDQGLLAIGRRTELKSLQNISPYLKEGTILRKAPDDFPSTLCILSDNTEIFDKLFPAESLKIIAAYQKYIKYLIISDALFIGTSTDKSGIQAKFMLPSIDDMEDFTPLLRLLIGHIIDATASFKLSDKAKSEVRKQRSFVEKKMIRDSEVEREEDLANKRAEKRMKEEELKGKMTEEQLKRFEEKQHKKSLKQKAPKMKIRRG